MTPCVSILMAVQLLSMEAAIFIKLACSWEIKGEKILLSNFNFYDKHCIELVTVVDMLLNISFVANFNTNLFLFLKLTILHQIYIWYLPEVYCCQ